MADAPALPHFNDPIARHARVDQPLLKANMTVEEALAAIRRQGLGERIIYFYVIDEHDRLAGVLPTRHLAFVSPSCAEHLPGAFSATASHGFSPQSSAAPSARSWRAPLRPPSPAASLSHSSSPWFWD